jgi:hypothetical protein
LHAEKQRAFGSFQAGFAQKNAPKRKEGGSMISVLIDAALRSLFVGLFVAVGLRALRICNVFAQETAVGLALAMPLMMAIADRFGLLPANADIVPPARQMTLLEELQAILLSKSGSDNVVKPAATPVPAANPPQAEESANRASAPRDEGSGLSSTQPAAAQPEEAPGRAKNPVALPAQGIAACFC